MRKTDKKIDNQLREVLTDVCETALESFLGFEWLTHTVNFGRFPKSLKIICVFDTNHNLSLFKSSGSMHELGMLIQKALFGINIHLKHIAAHIIYDTEEDCHLHHQGNWALRLAS